MTTLSKKEMRDFRYAVQVRSRGGPDVVCPMGHNPDLSLDHPLRKVTGPPEYTKWEPPGNKKKLLPKEP